MKVQLTISQTIELELDDRVEADDLRWPVVRAFEWSDGRQPFSSEMLERAFREVAQSIATNAQREIGYRLARKYPGLGGREYLLADRLVEATKTGYHVTRAVRVTNGDTVLVEGESE